MGMGGCSAGEPDTLTYNQGLESAVNIVLKNSLLIISSVMLLPGTVPVWGDMMLGADSGADRRIASMKNAFEEITESFRERVLELEQSLADVRRQAETDRAAALADRDAALAARDAAISVRDETVSRLKIVETDFGTLVTERDSLREKLQEMEMELRGMRAHSLDLEQEVRSQSSETDRLRKALFETQQANQRERFALAYNLGNIYKAARQYERAEAEFRKALEMKPGDAALHYNMGILYDDNLRNAGKARYHYERFLSLAPDDPDAPNVVKWLKELGVR